MSGELPQWGGGPPASRCGGVPVSVHPTSETRCPTIHLYEEKGISFQGYIPPHSEIQSRQRHCALGDCEKTECNYGFLWCFSTGMTIMVLQICLVSWGSECMSPSQRISCWPMQWLGACFDAPPQSCVPVESWGWIWMFSLNHACIIWLLIAVCAPEWVIFPNPLFLYRKIICFFFKKLKSVENIIRVQWDRCGCPL